MDPAKIKRETIEDASDTLDSLYDDGSAEPPKKKIRTARKCTAPGGKLPRQPIVTKPLRKTFQPVSSTPIRRVMPLRSTRSNSKPIVQNVQDSDDSDIEFLNDSFTGDDEKPVSKNMNENKDVLKKLDVLSKQGLSTSISKSTKRGRPRKNNNDSNLSKDESDIEVIDEESNIVCEPEISIVESILDLNVKSDKNTETEITLEPDVDIVESDEIICDNDVTIEKKDSKTSLSGIVESDDIICDTDVKNTVKLSDKNCKTEAVAEDIEIITAKDDVVSQKSSKIINNLNKSISVKKCDSGKETEDKPELIDLEPNAKKSVIEDKSDSPDIICEPDIILDEIDLEPNTRKTVAEDKSDEPGIICEPDIILDEIEVIEYLDGSDDSKNVQKSKRNPRKSYIALGFDEPSEIEVIDNTDKVSSQKKLNESINPISKTPKNLHMVEENLLDAFTQISW